MRGEGGRSTSTALPARAERQGDEVVGLREMQHGLRLQPRERHDQRCACRNTDRLAIERVAGSGIEKDAGGSKRGGVAEQAADIVMVGQADEPDHR